MKKGLPILLFTTILFQTLRAQTRLSLYEEFSNENCFPCAAVNPGVQALTASNSSKVVHITYPVSAPVSGPLSTAYPAPAAARAAYYSVTAPPQGRLNGVKLGSGTAFATPGHPGNLRQADIDSGASATPFSLSVSHAFNSSGDSVFITVVMATPAGYTGAPGTSLKLRAALIEDVQYPANPPGINGEQSFPATVREMYPNPAGTAVASTWTTGQTSNLVIRYTVQRLVDKSAANIVVWLQDDATKAVLQAALSTPVAIPVDAGISAAQAPQKIICASGTTGVAHNALLHNAGSNTLTSARIYYRADAAPVQYFNWSGTLAPGATTPVALPPLTVNAGGLHTFTDSVVQPNGSIDINKGNNVATGRMAVYNTVQQNLPVANGFEGGAIPAGWILYDADSNGRNWAVARNIFGGPAGFGGSTYFLLHSNYYVPAGETNYAILPAAKLPAGAKSLSFNYAHAQFATENDALDVVYSTDCGANWTSVWNASGASLSTAPATTGYFIPTASQWMAMTVDMSAVPANAMIAFRAVSDYGNSLYLDNVQLSAPAGIASSGIRAGSLGVRPNPATGSAFAAFYLDAPGQVRIRITDATGRDVAITSGYMNAGAQQIPLPIKGLTAGIYSVKIEAGGGAAVTRLVLQ